MRRLRWAAAALAVAVASPGLLGAEETVSERMLLEAVPPGSEALRFGTSVSHHDDRGYPESADGLLVLRDSADGPLVTVRGDPDPYLLYAQYANRQRDAVMLARTGTVRDVLPGGETVDVPYGYGAVRFNTVYVSIVESLLVPHFSDNQKEHVEFPLTDFYIGGSFGLTGVLGSLRYVHTEQYVGYIAAGYNPFRSTNPASVLSRYTVPVHLGGGYRFPGIFPEILGENNWTVGADLLLGFGRRGADPEQTGVLVPGAFIDVERVLFDERGLRRDYRSDPRPYNYRVNAVVFRAAAYLNVTNLGADDLFFPVFSLSYQYNVIGPRIPRHDFKETEILYVDDTYREDLRRQAERRDERSSR